MRRAKGLRDRIFKALGKKSASKYWAVIGKLKREGLDLGRSCGPVRIVLSGKAKRIAPLSSRADRGNIRT